MHRLTMELTLVLFVPKGPRDNEGFACLEAVRFAMQMCRPRSINSFVQPRLFLRQKRRSRGRGRFGDQFWVPVEVFVVPKTLAIGG
jgi:hypothetical protein